MRRAVERHLEDPMAEALLRGDIGEGKILTVKHRKGAKDLSLDTKDNPNAQAGEAEAAKG